MEAELSWPVLSVCGHWGQWFPPDDPTVACSRVVFLSWLFSFSASTPHVLKISGVAKAPAVFLPKKPSSSPWLAVGAQLSLQAASQAVSRGNSRSFQALWSVWMRRAASTSSAAGGSGAGITAGPSELSTGVHPARCTAPGAGGGWQHLTAFNLESLILGRVRER